MPFNIASTGHNQETELKALKFRLSALTFPNWHWNGWRVSEQFEDTREIGFFECFITQHWIIRECWEFLRTYKCTGMWRSTTILYDSGKDPDCSAHRTPDSSVNLSPYALEQADKEELTGIRTWTTSVWKQPVGCCSQARSLRQYSTVCHLMMVVWPKHIVAVASEEKNICCFDGPIIGLLIIHTQQEAHHSNHNPSKKFKTVYYCMPPDDGRMTETCCGGNIGRGGEDLLR
jgi:hypothetical protein